MSETPKNEAATVPAKEAAAVLTDTHRIAAAGRLSIPATATVDRRAIPLTSIVTDADTQVRSVLDHLTVAEYAAAMQAGDTFPPIVAFADGSHHYLADGFHRVAAAASIHRVEIVAEVRQGTATDALWYALGANRTHGLRLSRADMTTAVSKALRQFPDRSQRVIAEHVGCSPDTVCRIASELSEVGQLTRPERTTGKDGRSRPATRATSRTPTVPRGVSAHVLELMDIILAAPRKEWHLVAKAMRKVADELQSKLDGGPAT